ncbi:RUN domain-containing protein 1-like [Tubulanus polymorphus]|uniref:RUN domain-containing protein 1-like n=1 Tax=Tubulanus polymorphus TaxID=672921 RepID=UPI003DA3F99D
MEPHIERRDRYSTAVTDDDDVGRNGFDYDNETERYPVERWTPLGAASLSSLSIDELHRTEEDNDQLRQLEEEQEQLNSSLLALTTHFAQVQFRLKQIIDANPESKEDLLKELEEFAFRGIPDVRGCHIQDANLLEPLSELEHQTKINDQRRKQLELIEQLKAQLSDLETYAYETGFDQLPTCKVMEKQKVVIDQLKNKLDLDLDNFDRLSTEELRQVVDNAIGQIVNPAKVKEKLVDQLKTQIVDLERFIDFLQGEAGITVPVPGAAQRRCTCDCPVHKRNNMSAGNNGCGCDASSNSRGPRFTARRDEHKKVRDRTMSIVRRALAVLQIFAISQFGCAGQDFQKNLMKRTTKGNHYGDLLARLELAIDKVLETVKSEKEESIYQDSDYTSDSDVEGSTAAATTVKFNHEMTQVVRRDLAPALRDLMQHGLMEVGQSTSLVPWGCIPSRSASRASQKMMHAWDLLMKYYEMKHGREYNESPARKLSQSFDLDIVGGKAITAKQTLLGALDTVLSSHDPLKRSEDAKFKAFVCLGLNERKLSTWLRLVLRNTTMVDYYYQPWSYTAKTGFEDAAKSLSRLNGLDFHLSVDLAVKPFTNIKDAF